MELDFKTCERARFSRDARFDGLFYIAVKTTRIYCRPICTVSPPLSKNVQFFRTAVAAAEAGYRPCLRCRPECVPGSPAWNGTSTTVSRALRLIETGELDKIGVEDLASKLGMGSRQLSRLFKQHLGVSPLAVAKTRRLHFAKRLIDDSNLDMAQIAFAAGYGSVRSFNDVFKKIYQRTPGQLRKFRHHKGIESKSKGFSLVIPVRQPFDWASLIDFLSMRATPGVEFVGPELYTRTIELNGQPGRIEIRPILEKNCLSLQIHYPEIKSLFTIVERVKKIFDVNAATVEIAEHLGKSPLLEPVVGAFPGLRVPGCWDGFEIAVRAILGQQISVKGATTLAGRVACRFGLPITGPDISEKDGLSHLFPGSEILSKANLAEVGVVPSRALAIKELAKIVCREQINFDPGQKLEPFIEGITKVKGIGDWTAQYIAMRALRNTDAFPSADLVLLKAASYNDDKVSVKQIKTMSESWRPWRAYSAMYLWKKSGWQP